MSGGHHGTVKARQHAPARQQVWQAMRILRQFTIAQLEVTCDGVTYNHAAKYALRLRRTGFVALSQARRLGQPGERDVLRLVRNTGPQAPIPRHAAVQVFDPNTGRTWGNGGEEIADAVTAPSLPSDTQRVVLMCLLAGLPPERGLPDPDNRGTLGNVLRALRLRGLVDAAGALTDAGRQQATADQAVHDAICPPGWIP